MSHALVYLLLLAAGTRLVCPPLPESATKPALRAAAAVARSVQGRGSIAGTLLHAALLELDGAGFRVPAAGPADATAAEPLWRVEPGLAPGRWPTPGGAPLPATSLANSYNSTARSASSTGLHLSCWDRQALRAVFAAVVRRSTYDKDGAGTCVERQGFTWPGKTGRQATDAVTIACDGRSTRDDAWTVDASPAPIGTLRLVLGDARGRAVSRHRWTGVAYDPPEFRS